MAEADDAMRAGSTCPDPPCPHFVAAIGATLAGQRADFAARLAAAIATIEHSRQTHVEWRDYLRRSPDYQPGAIGDADYHDQAVREYDNVLAVLTGDPR